MITISQLTKHYEGFSLNVSLNVPKGRVTGIVGKNGAGKSTILKTILGLVTPDAGSVCVFDKAASQLTNSDRERIGVTLAESGFSSLFTVAAIGRILGKMYPAFDNTFFQEQVKQLELPQNKPLKTFSTGMKAKVRVLTAISHQADLLILDEPTSGLDVLARKEILNLLRNYMAQNPNRSILMTSHISSDLEDLCDDLYFLHSGRILLHEDVANLLGSYAVMKVTEEQLRGLDQTNLLAVRKTSSGCSCLTNKKQLCQELYPEIPIDNSSVDELIAILLQEDYT